ncbi:MAG: hypothetical protein Q4C04_00610 [Clostridia bacterium]|nr:hypothetical protein [Clostridia bacterium]
MRASTIITIALLVAFIVVGIVFRPSAMDADAETETWFDIDELMQQIDGSAYDYMDGGLYSDGEGFGQLNVETTPEGGVESLTLSLRIGRKPDGGNSQIALELQAEYERELAQLYGSLQLVYDTIAADSATGMKSVSSVANSIIDNLDTGYYTDWQWKYYVLRASSRKLTSGKYSVTLTMELMDLNT